MFNTNSLVNTIYYYTGIIYNYILLKTYNGKLENTLDKDTVDKYTLYKDRVDKDTVDKDTLDKDTLDKDTLDKDKVDKDIKECNYKNANGNKNYIEHSIDFSMPNNIFEKNYIKNIKLGNFNNSSLYKRRKTHILNESNNNKL